MQTTMIFKIDKKLKEAGQRTAKRMGVPFSTILNEYVRELVANQEITLHAFRDVEDELWIERAMKAEKKGKYLGVKKSEASLKRIINATPRS